MTVHDIFIAQLLDPFRIGLLLALLLTARNTMAHTGMVLPLGAGVLFIAALIPLSFSAGAENWWTLFAIGIISNCVIVAIVLGLRFVFLSFISRRE